jgi:hypothetical protein
VIEAVFQLGDDPRDPLAPLVRHAFVSVPPSAEADQLAVLLSREALRALQSGMEEQSSAIQLVQWGPLRATASGRDAAGGHPIVIDGIREEVSTLGVGVGLPLSTSIIPGHERFINAMIRAHTESAPNTKVRRQLASQLLSQEAKVWKIASEAGAAGRTLPFAARIRALRCWWTPDPGQYPKAPLCARCGRFEPAGATHHGAPFCDHCVKDPSLTRTHAIAPADRGTWWLHCQAAGCRNIFIGRSQARRCPRCRLAQTSPNQRRPLRGT